MDWLNSIVKVEHPSLIPSLLHSTLSNYGEIEAFLPCNVKDAATKHFFVRYNSPQAAQRAYSNQHTVQGLRISTLCQDPGLLDQYLTACSLNMNKEPVYKRGTVKETLYAPEKDAYTQPKSRRRSKNRKPAKTQLKRYPERSESCRSTHTPVPNRLLCAKERSAALGTSSSQLQKDALTLQPGVKAATPSSTSADLSVPKQIMRKSGLDELASFLSPAGSPVKHPTQQPIVKVASPCTKRLTPQPTVKTASPSFTSASLSTKRRTQHITKTAIPSSTSFKRSVFNEPDKDYPKTSVQLSSLHHSSSSIIAVPAVFCVATKMELRVAGEQFIYDLNKLEDDPKSIIELLKLASAERAHWMIVGAFYRRRGKAHAAIKIMMELIEVLKGQSVDEDKMKPIYLMLSGCEADLAKIVKDRSPSSYIASTHYLKSQAWLQKVYGTFDNSNNLEQVIFNDSATPRNSERPDNVEYRAARHTSDVGEGCKRRRLCKN